MEKCSGCLFTDANFVDKDVTSLLEGCHRGGYYARRLEVLQLRKNDAGHV